MQPLKKEKKPAQALSSLMRLASRAEKCTGDARRLMRGWGIAPAEADKILARLTSEKFIDDERYAVAYTREKIRFSGWGVHKIGAALSAKGIPREIIARATAGLDEEAMGERLEKHLKRKKTLIKTSNPYDMRSKLTRYGLSLGYDYDTVARTLERILVVLALLVPCFSVAQPTQQASSQPARQAQQSPAADYYRSPLDIPIYLSANFGEIRTNRFHTGVDIKTQGVVGKPLYAAADGYIARVTVAPGGYGRALYIAHPNGTTTVYCHLDRFTRDVEDYLASERYLQLSSDIDAFPPADRFPVKKGDPIGLAGNSGASTGPHLHFEVRESATSRTLNVVPRGWISPTVEDTTPPLIVKLYHVDVDTVAGVPLHSKARAHDVRLNPDGSYSLVRTSPLKAGPTSYFVVEATDRMNGVVNTFGIYRAGMMVDRAEKLLFEKDGVTFADIRYACASVLYDIQRRSRNEAVMLAVKSGNRLPMYKKAVDRGVITTSETGTRTIRITVEDDAGNTATLSFEVERNPDHTPPSRPEGRVASDKSDFVNYSDGLMVSIPKGALYEPMFYTQSTVETAPKPRADGIRPLSPLHRTGDGVLPLQRPMQIAIAAPIPDSLQSKASLAKVSADGTLAYAGGRYSDGSVSGTLRDFGTYCVVVDTTPPTVSSSFTDGADLTSTAGITLTATDNFSGIAHFTGTIDGQWIIFERTASRGRFFHRFDTARLARGTTHTLEFTVRDGCGNTTTLKRTFRK